MSKMFLLVFVVALAVVIVIVVLMVEPIIVVLQYFQPLRSLHFIIVDEFAMIERNHWKHLVYLFSAVVCVHVLSGYFELLIPVFDDPVATDWQQPDHLGDFAEKMVIYDDCALSYLLLALHLWCYCVLFGLYSGGWVLVSKNVIFFHAFFTWLTRTFCSFFIRFLVKHAVVLGHFSCYFLLVILDFGHKTQVDESINLSILIFRPNVFLGLFTFELLAVWQRVIFGSFL
jgi:hypothetical protein